MTGMPGERRWIEDGETHIDLRGLAPPQPLVTILRLLRSVQDDTRVVAYLDRDPVMLYPELAEMGWEAERTAGGPGEVTLRLRRTQ